jgi:hypothetical protein
MDNFPFCMNDNAYKFATQIMTFFFVVFLMTLIGRSRMWADFTQDGNGRYVFIRWCKTIAYFLGFAYMIVAVGSNIILKMDMPYEPCYILFGTAMVAQAVKSTEDVGYAKVNAEANSAPKIEDVPLPVPPVPGQPLTDGIQQAAVQFFPSAPVTPVPTRRRAKPTPPTV